MYLFYFQKVLRNICRGHGEVEVDMWRERGENGDVDNEGH